MILDPTPHYGIILLMNETKRTRRTPEQLIADAQSRLDKLQAKAAETEAASNPLLAPLLAEIKEVEKAELMARKGFSKGPQNFDERIAKAQARIDKITAQQAEAEQVIEDAKARKAELRAALADLTQAIAKGEDITEGDVFLALEA
jgi:DNA repair exonuclease SbcCD ATPase subunit